MTSEGRNADESYNFKNLLLWQQAQEFSVSVARLVDHLPRSRSADVVCSQLMRSASSVAANIAKGSAAESRSWVDLLARLGHIDGASASSMDEAAARLIAALTRHIRGLERREQEDEASPSSGSKVPRFKGSTDGEASR